MTVVDNVSAYKKLIQASFANAMGTMEYVHQASVDLSVSLFKELGFWGDTAERYRIAHQRGLHTIYTSIVEVNDAFGEMIVKQAENLSEFTEVILASLPSPPPQEDDAEAS
jgi:hypothetical protein